MDMETFVRQCRECDVTDTEKVTELLGYAAQLGEAVLSARDKHTDKIPYEQVRQMYNDICVSLPKACKLTNERKRHIKSCFAQKFTAADFEKAFRTVQGNPFLRGENERGWHANFDWLIKPANLIKVIEGNYSRTEPVNRPPDELEQIWRNAKSNTPKI